MSITIFSSLLSNIVSVYGANDWRVQRIVNTVNASPSLMAQWEQAEALGTAGPVVIIGAPGSEATNANADRILIGGRYFASAADGLPTDSYGALDLTAKLAHELQHTLTYRARLTNGDSSLTQAGSVGHAARNNAAIQLEDELSSKLAEFNALNSRIPGNIFAENPTAEDLAKIDAIRSRFDSEYFDPIKRMGFEASRGLIPPILDDDGNLMPLPQLFAAWTPTFNHSTGSGTISTYESQQFVNGLNRLGDRLPPGAVISTTLDPQLLVNSGFVGNALFIDPNTGISTRIQSTRISQVPGNSDTSFTYVIERDGLRVAVSGSVTTDSLGNKVLIIDNATAFHAGADTHWESGNWNPMDMTEVVVPRLQQALSSGNLHSALQGTAQALLGEAAALQGVNPPRYASSDVNETVIPSGPLNQSVPGATASSPRILVDAQNNISFVDPTSDGSVTVTVDRNGHVVRRTTSQTDDDGNTLVVTTHADGSGTVAAYDPDNSLINSASFQRFDANGAGSMTGAQGTMSVNIGGQNAVFDVSFEGDSSGTGSASGADAGSSNTSFPQSITPRSLASVNGQAPANASSVNAALQDASLTGADLLNGNGDAAQLVTAANPASASGVYLGSPATSPSAPSTSSLPSTSTASPPPDNTWQPGYSALSTSRALINAVKSGKSLPIASALFNSGATFANSDAVRSISAHLNILGSLKGLSQSLKHGDALGILSNGGGLVNTVYGEYSQNNSCSRTFHARNRLFRHSKTVQKSCQTRTRSF